MAQATFEQSHTTAAIFSQRAHRRARKIVSPYPGTHKGDLFYDFVDSIIGKAQPLVKAQEVMMQCLSVWQLINLLFQEHQKKFFIKKLNEF